MWYLCIACILIRCVYATPFLYSFLVVLNLIIAVRLPQIFIPARIDYPGSFLSKIHSILQVSGQFSQGSKVTEEYLIIPILINNELLSNFIMT